MPTVESKRCVQLGRLVVNAPEGDETVQKVIEHVEAAQKASRNLMSARDEITKIDVAIALAKQVTKATLSMRPRSSRRE